MAKSSKMFPRRISLSIWILPLLVMLPLIVGFFLGLRYQQEITAKMISSRGPNTPSNPTSQFEMVTNERDDAYLTYKDSKNKFSVDVPVGFKRVEDDHRILRVAKEIEIYSTTEDPSECLALCPVVLTDERITFNGIPVRKIVSEKFSPGWEGYSYKIIEYIVERENQFHVIKYTQDPQVADDTKTVEEIAKSFKFL